MANAPDKQKIRNRYKGISRDELEAIPAIEKKDIFRDDSPKRVGVYARVSTGDPRQTSSFELQQNHYTDLIDRRPGWTLYKIYADEGISGTSLKHRDAFLQMIADCKAHKLDLIVTKSVSRFARNIYDCIGYVRELAALKPPVGVLFETENLYTLKEDYEMSLSFIATLAQEESHTKSSSMNLSYEMRFSRGIFMTPELLGYDKDENGNLVINEDEALTVRLIFFMFLYGYSAQQIAETLMQLKRVTKKGNYKWSASTVMSILQNERHCGDVLAHKTYTPNYLNHRAVKNRGEKAQYRQRDHHEGIISRDDFIAVQQIIAYGQRGHAGLLPQIHVIDRGALRGFIIINPRWAGFTSADYLDAVEIIAPAPIEDAEDEVTVTPELGSVDMRGFEIVRSQFFESNHACAVTICAETIKFTAFSLQKLNNCTLVEFLFDPIRKLFVVRPTNKGNRNAITWLSFDGKKHYPRKILGRAYLPIIYELMGWNNGRSYHVQGECLGNGENALLVFSMSDAEAVIKQQNQVETVAPESTEPLVTTESAQTIMAMPEGWLSNFGSEYYSSTSLLPTGNEAPHEWNAQDTGKPSPRKDSLAVTSESELKDGIDSIIAAIKEGSIKDEPADNV
jgi:DNA invertase Pin-like site-specific DNA recombinase